MQVKDVARLTGTTVRTIRHYHAVGLLPVPEARAGRRDYDVSHVSRVSRIRWLADSGLTLARIAEVLAEERPATNRHAAVLEELRSTGAVLDARIEELTAQRSRLDELLHALERGEALSPLPDVVRRHYDAVEGRAPDEAVRHRIRREREFLELAYLRGEVPRAAEALYAAMDDASQEATVAAFARQLEGPLDDVAVDEVARGNVERIVSRLGGRDGVAATLDAEQVSRLYALFAATGDERDRRIGEAMLRGLLAALDAAQAEGGGR